MKNRDKADYTGPQRPVTIADIAREANVSVSTVSRVLNNSSEVGKATKKRILKLIEEHDYMPSELARGLVNQTSKTIGLLIPDVLNNYYSELINSAEAVISRHGFSLFLCITGGEPAKEDYYINDMLKRRTNGLLILSTKITNQHLLKRMRRSIELVSVDADIPGVDKVCVSSEPGTHEVVSHLIDYGHRDIAFIGYQFYLSSLQQRVEGYRRAMLENGIPINESYIIEGEPTGNSGYTMTKHLLGMAHPPTAIHCINEHIAAGAYLAIAEAGLKIPDDISVTAFDNLEVSQLLTPKLTTAGIPINQMGETAAELLIRNINEGHRPIEQIVTFPTKLYIRASTRRVEQS